MKRHLVSILLTGILFANTVSVPVWGEDPAAALPVEESLYAEEAADPLPADEQKGEPEDSFLTGSQTDLINDTDPTQKEQTGDLLREEERQTDGMLQEDFRTDGMLQEDFRTDGMLQEDFQTNGLLQEVESPPVNEEVPEEEPSEPSFERGYVIVLQEAEVYRDPVLGIPDGTFLADTVVYGERVLIEGLEGQDWLQILFDAASGVPETAEDPGSVNKDNTGTNESVISDAGLVIDINADTDEDAFSFRYVKAEDVVFLTEDEEAAFRDGLAADPSVRFYGDIVVPAAYTYEYAEPAAGAPSLSEQNREDGRDISGDNFHEEAGIGDGTQKYVSVESLHKEGVFSQTPADAKSTGDEDASFSILFQPVDVKTDVGGSAFFCVDAYGKGLSYQWQWQAKGGSTWSDTSISGARSDTLKITNAAAGFDGRKYRCVVTDSFGEILTSDAATLTVGGADIFSQPVSRNVDVGGSVSFTVAASGSGLTYQWQWQAPGSSSWADTSILGARSSTLQISDAPVSFNGRKYRCVVGDSSGKKTESTAAVLTVINVAITQQPKNADILSGENAAFHVAASGNGLTYQWQWQAKGSTAWSNTSIAGARTDTLQITGAPDSFDGRKYRCVVNNVNGKKAESSAATLTVRPVRILSQPANAKIDLGGTAVFNVKAEGPGLTYQWQWQAPGSTSWNNTSLTGAATTTLTVKDPPASFNGRKFRCVIKNPSGRQTASNAAILTVVNLVITTQPQNIVVQSNSTASFRISASGTGLTYQWQWQAPGSSSWQNTSISGATTKTLQLTNLSLSFNGRKYQCIVKNVNGKTVVSNAASLTVKDPTGTGNSSQTKYSHYVCNKKSLRFHYPDCSSVAKMSESNKWYTDKSREELIAMNYQPCGICHP